MHDRRGAAAPPPAAPLRYRDAGVDIDAGDEVVERIKPHARFLSELRGLSIAAALSPKLRARAGLGQTASLEDLFFALRGE